MSKWKGLLKKSMPFIALAVKETQKDNETINGIENIGLIYLQQLTQHLVSGDTEKLKAHLNKTVEDK